MYAKLTTPLNRSKSLNSSVQLEAKNNIASQTYMSLASEPLKYSHLF